MESDSRSDPSGLITPGNIKKSGNGKSHKERWLGGPEEGVAVAVLH